MSAAWSSPISHLLGAPGNHIKNNFAEVKSMYFVAQFFRQWTTVNRFSHSAKKARFKVQPIEIAGTCRRTCESPSGAFWISDITCFAWARRAYVCSCISSLSCSAYHTSKRHSQHFKNDCCSKTALFVSNIHALYCVLFAL